MTSTPSDTLRVPSRHDIEGLVLAGGRGSRLGGVDKGLQPWQGRPLVDHVLERFQPQVGRVRVSANRNLEHYAARGVPVVTDDDPTAFDGPLAGVLAGLRQAEAPWVALVPCDAPRLPLDLVARLAAGTGPDGAVATQPGLDGTGGIEPLFCLVRTGLADSLAGALAAGERRVVGWLMTHRVASVSFDRTVDVGAFANFNRPVDLRA